MGLIIQASLKKEDLDRLSPDQMVKGKTARYIPLSIYVDEKLDKFKNNVSIQLSQSKEDREAKKPKTYLGNGKVIFAKGEIKTAKELQDDPF